MIWWSNIILIYKQHRLSVVDVVGVFGTTISHFFFALGQFDAVNRWYTLAIGWGHEVSNKLVIGSGLDIMDKFLPRRSPTMQQ